jgi:hypothetical protein
MLAVLMLSLGVGATTAVFALVDGIMPRSTPSQPCETVMSLSSLPSKFAVAKVTSDAIGDIPDLANGVGPRPVLALLGAAALAFLLACTRAASGMIARARVSLVALGTLCGALVVAALSLRALGLPSLGVRAMAFALCISLLAVYFARLTQRRAVPLTI